VQGQFRFRTKTGHDLIRRDRKNAKQMTVSCQVVQEDGRSNAEVAIGCGIIEHARIGAVISRRAAGDCDRGCAPSNQRYIGGQSHTPRRQNGYARHEQEAVPV